MTKKVNGDLTSDPECISLQITVLILNLSVMEQF